MPEEAMHKTTLYLPVEIRVRLRSLARASGRPQAELIREALREYLSENDVRPSPTSLGSGEDDGLNAADTAEWLRRSWQP